MKLFKIGSNPACDIVVNNDYVSEHHADLTLLDNGDIIIEDKSSTNGTFVGNKRLNPNQETPIRRGDYVRFANETLNWARVPSLPSNAKYKNVVNIGTNYRNNIVINSPSVSRYHASLKIEKNGKAYIVDNGSKNGTQVNGVRIPADKPTRVKRGDNVICGGEDITDQLQAFIRSSFPTWAIVSSIIGAVAAAIVLAVIYLPGLWGPGQDKFDVDDYRNTVTYVRAAFHYEVSLKDNPLDGDQLVQETPIQRYTATAFFIDDEGRMATNRHIALPWAPEYRDKETTELLKQEYQKWLVNQLQVSDLNAFSVESIVNAVYLLKRTDLGIALLDKCEDETDLKAMIDRIQKSEIEIKGVMDFITVGYAGKFYTNEDELKRCHVICESKDKEVDIAILQLNENKTPSDVIRVFDPHEVVTEQLKPQQDKLYIFGYPHGIEQNQDESTFQLDPNLKTSRCSKTPSRYNFELQEMVQGGSSGSPVFNEKGMLVGIVSSGLITTNVSFAVQARYLKKLYETEIEMKP